MYQKFYGLTENPFTLTPDPKYLYFTPRHQEALAQLYYGITERKGIMALIGEVGTGKTLLLNKLMEALGEDDILAAYVFNPSMTPTDLFEYIAADFGLEVNVGSKSRFLMKLNELLIERFRENKITVLIIDEAQNLSFDVLEELRMLTNLETSREKLIQIVLSGQPELAGKLDHPTVRQLKQRIALRCRLKSLSLDETRDYIRSRLEIAGLTGPNLFTDGAITRVHEISGGIPRLINNICDNALVSGFSYDKQTIDKNLINEVADDLQLTPPTSPVIKPATTGRPSQSDDGSLATQSRLAHYWEMLRLSRPLRRLVQYLDMARAYPRTLLRGRSAGANRAN